MVVYALAHNEVHVIPLYLCIVRSLTTEIGARMEQLDVALSSCWLSVTAPCVPPEVPSALGMYVP